MQDDPRRSKVTILLNQKRFDSAEKILRDLLSEEPNDVQALALLVECYLGQDKMEDARTISNTTIGLIPDEPFLYYLRARVSIQENKLVEAEKDLKQAIHLYAFDADYFALLAQIKLAQKEFDEALDLSEQALEIDATNLLALNTRSTALIKLDRKEASFQTIEGALREDPNNPYTHANYGWGLLEKGNHKKALHHFKEALQADPTYEYAQSGMLEAIRATNPIYRAFLKYVFWIDNLTSKYQWGFLIGFYLCFQVIRRFSDANPALQPYLTPLLFILAAIAFSTWIIKPISNLFLRFNPYGKLLLTEKEKMSSNFVATSLLVAVWSLIGYFIASDARYLSITFIGVVMMIPCSIMFQPAKYKNAFLIYTLIMGIVGLLSIYVAFTQYIFWNQFSLIFIFGIFALQWISNFISIEQDQA
jgi:tetratricopeptide (TPR) repeat protein